MGFLDFLGSLRRLTDDERFSLEFFQHDEAFEDIKKYVKQKRIQFESISAGFTFLEDNDYLYITTTDTTLEPLVTKMNGQLKHWFEHRWFNQFKEKAYELIPRLLARTIIGLEPLKRALTLQMVAPPLFHILLVNDEGLGAHHFFSGIEQLIENRTCCIGTELEDSNLFAQYDQGMMMVDEFESIKRPIKQALLPIMDNGIVDQEVGVKISRIKILAACHPLGGRFSRTYESLRRQLPVEPALVHRFDLIFINRVTDIVTRGGKIIRDFEPAKPADKEFVKAYLNYAQTIQPILPNSFDEDFIDYVEYLQQKFEHAPKPITERMIDTMKKLMIASARLELREVVEAKDFQRAREIIENSLTV
ncbi:MAG: hypothetical protein Q7R56_01595 [Nanoarchaeota archaeon]|nr:hypothetical protein [Nanoarchaeota archaeon]